MIGRIKRESQSGIKFPRIGMIKTGYKDHNRPKSTDYFIATGKYSGLFNSAYGDKPQKLHIVFWNDDPIISCNERYEYRDNEGRLYAYGDGQNFEIWNENKKIYDNYTKQDHPDIMQRVANKYQKNWEVTLTLRFILPMLKNIAGYWQYSTKAVASSIPTIRDTFDAMLESRGSISGVVFDMNVSFATSQKPGIRSRYPVVNIVPNQTPENVEAVKQSFLKLS